MTTTTDSTDTGTDDDKTTTDTGGGSTTTTTTTDTATETAELAAELAKWKALSRKNEQAAKANSKALEELDGLKAAAMSEQEKAVKKAVEAAKVEARKEALHEVGGKLAEAAIRVAAAGRNVDVEALLEGVDPARFLDDDGDPDVKAITAWMDRVAPAVDDKDKVPVRRDLGQGARGGQAPALNSTQLERDLRTKLGIS